MLTDRTRERRWPPGASTGIGSLPGTDAVEAARTVFGECPELPHLVELPARGPAGDMIGRSAALLVDLPVEIVPSGWRFTAHPGRDLRQARDLLARDLDALAEAADGYRGALKVQAAGPWTLAAGVELPSGHPVLTDHGAARELAASLAEGLRAHLAEVVRQVPGARLVLQLDEPSLPAVLTGRIPTASGYGTVRAIAAETARDRLRDVLAVAEPGARVMHCCAPDSPITLLHDAGADAFALDAELLGSADYDQLGPAVDAGAAVLLGVVPAMSADLSLANARDRAYAVARALAIDPAELAAVVVPTPACGLASASAEYARRALAIVRELGRELLDPTRRCGTG